MAEALLTFSARELLKKVAILAGEEFRIVWGFKKELEKLQTTSDKLQGPLQAAENLTHNLDERTVKPWVAEIERIASAADDLLDDFGYEVRRRKVEEKKVLSLFDPLVFRHKMGRRIKKINESLEKLEKQAASFQLVIAGNARSDDYGVLDRQTVPCFDDDEKNMIGRDGFVSNIVKTLISIKEDLPVSAINVGMAGLGKTTVAKAIYNDDQIDAHFKQKIWVCVSIPFDVEMILSGILEYLSAEKAAVRGKAAILNHLQEQLIGKKYLLVLDDVWNEDVSKWSDLRNSLLSIGGTKGSSIIVTTRNGKVAEVMETLLRSDIGKLSDDECWHILKRNAVATGKEIAKKCGGVPLAAKVLGSLMRFKSHSEWLEIERSSIWDLESTRGGGGVGKLLSDDKAIGSKFSGFKTLRVLKIDEKYIELPNSFGKLKHLRYLDVSHTYEADLDDSHTNIAAFPKSIGKIYNLQTLRFPSNLDVNAQIMHVCGATYTLAKIGYSVDPMR